MKNPFLLASAILSTTYPAAVAGELVGVLPLGVINFPTFIGFFTASGVLALALCDYARKGPAYDASQLTRRPSQGALPTYPAALRGAAWVHHTVSS